MNEWKPSKEGRINEKERSYGKRKSFTTQDENEGFNPEVEISHLLHAIVGVDRYPNYLTRWNHNVNDIHKFESALENLLDKVRSQKRELVRRNELSSIITQGLEEEDLSVLDEPIDWSDINDILDSRAVRAIFQSKMFRQKDRRPSLADVLGGKIRIELDASELEELLDEEALDTYSFPLLSEDFCHKIKKVAKAFMNNIQDKDTITRPLDMDSIGASWLNNLIFHLIICPISKHLFYTTESLGDLDWRQGYIAGYSSQIQRTKLVPHTDDSEVTLNIGMGDADFEGGDLVFWGLRGTKTEGRRGGDIHPQVGKAIIHSGRHLHEVSEVTDGERFVFIIWARSWSGIRKVTCPCCWLHRRQNNEKDSKPTCICSPTWN